MQVKCQYEKNVQYLSDNDLVFGQEQYSLSQMSGKKWQLHIFAYESKLVLTSITKISWDETHRHKAQGNVAVIRVISKCPSSPFTC